MRQSCNGCRVLRKGCNKNCSIKPCLEWIKNTDSQANATVFLAKFYGRAGILNLINAGPQHLRPAIFKSLLYEACGRIVNPVYGSVGLLWSGKWQLCQNAVDAVLKGAPITRIAIEDDAAVEVKNEPPLKSHSQAIKHVNNKEGSSNLNNLLRVRNRYRFKKSGSKSMGTSRVWVGLDEDDESSDQLELGVNRSTSHDSSLSHQSEMVVQGEIRDIENSVCGTDEKPALEGEKEPEEKPRIQLELTLGF